MTLEQLKARRAAEELEEARQRARQYEEDTARLRAQLEKLLAEQVTFTHPHTRPAPHSPRLSPHPPPPQRAAFAIELREALEAQKEEAVRWDAPRTQGASHAQPQISHPTFPISTGRAAAASFGRVGGDAH